MSDHPQSRGSRRKPGARAGSLHGPGRARRKEQRGRKTGQKQTEPARTSAMSTAALVRSMPKSLGRGMPSFRAAERKRHGAQHRAGQRERSHAGQARRPRAPRYALKGRRFKDKSSLTPELGQVQRLDDLTEPVFKVRDLQGEEEF